MLSSPMSTTREIPDTTSATVVEDLSTTTRIIINGAGSTFTTISTVPAGACGGIQGYYACPPELGAGCCPQGFQCGPNVCLPPGSSSSSFSNPVLGSTVGVITTPTACLGYDGFIACASSIGGESSLPLPSPSHPMGLGLADSPPSQVAAALAATYATPLSQHAASSP